MKLIAAIGLLFLVTQVFAEEPASQDAPAIAKRGIPAYRHLGCWRDTHIRAIPYIGRVFGAGRVRKCARMARNRGFRVFAVQAVTFCFGGARAHLTYKKYGRRRNCAHGTGGRWANDVYRLKRLAYVAVGCFKDTGHRALPVYLGYKRGDIGWCYRQAKARGYKIFAVQYYGQCFSGPTAQATYAKYGAKNGCLNGIGKAWANYVYRITVKPGRKFRKINRRPVCFGARGNRPGVFRYYGPSRVVNGLLLVFRRGRISCHTRAGWRWSRWGCGDANLIVVVTDQYNYLIYPRKEYINTHLHRRGLWYRLPGKHSKLSRSLLLSNVASPFHLTPGMPLKVWYGEDLRNYTEGDNGGSVCVDVYAWFA